MSTTNSVCVKRSNAVLDYSPKLVFRESDVHVNFMTAFVSFFQITVAFMCLMCWPLQWVLKKFVLPKPGSGPSKEILDKGYLKITGIGKGSKGSSVKSTLYFPTDPGYRDTARMLIETGLLLALESDKLTIGGGVWTPACLGERLLDRLVATGCEWKTTIE